MRGYIIICEGITDCSIVEAIIEKSLEYKSYKSIKELPILFSQMIQPYPNELGELQKKDSPVFYYKENICIAVKQANGYTNIPKLISAYLEIISKEDLYDVFGGFLVICDTDTKSREELEKYYRESLESYDISYDNEIIEYEKEDIRCKIHFIPQEGQGAVEKLLLECSEAIYNDLYNDAKCFRQKIMEPSYEKVRNDCWVSNSVIQQFYGDKVQFGVISTVLKPDRPVRFAIKDRLISRSHMEKLMDVPEFLALHKFLLNYVI